MKRITLRNNQTTVTLINGDIVDYLRGHAWLRDYDGDYFHGLLSDPPYNLDSILKRFGGNGAAPAQYGTDGLFARSSRGFMGQQWDTDIAYSPALWELITPHLHPGAFTAAFSHSRKFHRLATAQEQAGYLINPTLLAWIYGSGNPNGTSTPLYINDPATAQDFDGYYHGSPLKPEYEPIVVSQKPYAPGRTVDSITATGAGALNIDGGRYAKVGSRFPGTVLIVHHPACRQMGLREIKNGSGSVTGDEPSALGKNVNKLKGSDRQPREAYGNANGIELVPDYDCHPACPARRLEESNPDKLRYFAQFDWRYEVSEQLAATNPAFYSGKVSTTERNAGCEGLPLKTRSRANSGGWSNDPKWADTLQENDHPTLKPIALTQWLATLLAPPPAYAPRRLLVPFCGTGSEIIGAILSGGWEEIVGVELSPDYFNILVNRVAFFLQWAEWGHNDVTTILDVWQSQQEQDERQLALW